MYIEYVIYKIRDTKPAANLVHCGVQKIDNRRKSFAI